MSNYWIVGSKFGGTDEAIDVFIHRGYWYCWDNIKEVDETKKTGNSLYNQLQRFKKIQIGDKIAVKTQNISNQTMEIKALGIVKDIDLKEWRVYIDWKIQFDSEERIVPLSGCGASIHGPYQYSNNGIPEIFSI